MIAIKGKRVQLTEEDRKIGLIGDNLTDYREFSMPKLYKGLDLSGYSAWICIDPVMGEPYNQLLAKTISGDNIILKWTITNQNVQYDGAIGAVIKLASTATGNPVWQTYKEQFVVSAHVDTNAEAAVIPPNVFEQAVASAAASATAASNSAYSAAASSNTATTKASQASTSSAAAASSAATASAAASDATNAKNAAGGFAGDAYNYKQAAAGSATAAQTSATNASDYELQAYNHMLDAGTSMDTAVAAKNDAVTAKDTAVSARNETVIAKDIAITARNEAVASATAAANSEQSAEDSADAAALSATTAEGHATTAATQAGIATEKADIVIAAADAETARQAAELERISAEDIRIGNETGRTTAEGLRVTAEQNRATAESGRVSAEQNRVNAESVRQTGYTGFDGRITTVESTVNLPATNLITNGDFGQGTTGWTLRNDSTYIQTVENGRYKCTIGEVINTTDFYLIQNFSKTIGNKYYIRYEIQPTRSDGNNTLQFGNASQGNVLKPNENNIVSAVLTPINNNPLVINHRTTNYVTGESFYISNVICINLTTTFGAGNEPTAAQMDALLSRFHNSWFNGTVNLFDAGQTIKRVNALETGKADKAQEAWITPTLLNGWVNGSYGGTVGFRKNNFSEIEFKGYVMNGTVAQTIFVLPAGYRPVISVYVPCWASSSVGTLLINSAGEVKLATGVNTQVSLNSIKFIL